ncbi:MAG: MATE family efflux transporter [Lachnospiraceae bacterium]|nr:MATE family efflux transporter [Lachnospiraceae bacterium]
MSIVFRKHNDSIDMLNGSLADKILLYALPLMFGGMLQQLFNAADIAVVGKFVGKEAMAAVGSNGALVNLIVNMFIGISIGANVVIASEIGRGHKEAIRKAVHTSIVLAFICGIILLFLGQVLAPAILSLMSVPEEVFPLAVRYLRIYFIGMPAIVLFNYESAILRSVGDTTTPLKALAIAGVINVALNIFLVAVCHLSVAGVAIATAVSNLISSLFLMDRLTKTDSAVKLDLKELRLDPRSVKRMLSIGIPSGVQGMAFSISNVAIQSSINSLGTTVMAGSSASISVEALTYFVINSFGQACTTFTGQNYGAMKAERCRKALVYCILLDYLLTGATAAVLLPGGRFILSFFNSEPAVIEVGLVRMRYMYFCYLFSILMECSSGYLRGFGISLAPSVICMLGTCGIRILWIFTVFRALPTFPVLLQSYTVSLLITDVVLGIAILLLRPSQRAVRKAPAPGQ